MDTEHRRRNTGQDSPRSPRSPRREPSGPVKPFAIGFALGCLVSGILAVVITNAPVPLIAGASSKPGSALEGAAGSATSASSNSATSAVVNAGNSAASSPSAVNGGSAPNSAPNTAAKAPTPASAASGGTSAGGFFVQVGAYRSRDEAERQQAQLALLGFESKLFTAPNDNIVRVRLGPFGSASKANETRGRLSDAGVQSTLIKP